LRREVAYVATLRGQYRGHSGPFYLEKRLKAFFAKMMAKGHHFCAAERTRCIIEDDV
jgi:hypothetical protein